MPLGFAVRESGGGGMGKRFPKRRLRRGREGPNLQSAGESGRGGEFRGKGPDVFVSDKVRRII